MTVRIDDSLSVRGIAPGAWACRWEVVKAVCCCWLAGADEDWASSRFDLEDARESAFGGVLDVEDGGETSEDDEASREEEGVLDPELVLVLLELDSEAGEPRDLCLAANALLDIVKLVCWIE